MPRLKSSLVSAFVFVLTVMNSVSFLNFLWASFGPLAEISVLVDILTYENIGNAVIFDCSDAQTGIITRKIFNMNGIRVTNTAPDSNISLQLSHDKLGLILNESCSHWNSAFDNTKLTLFFKNPFVWLILTENLTAIQENLSQYPVEIDSNVIIVVKMGAMSYQLYEMYHTGFYTNGKFHTEHLGFWNTSLYFERKRRTDLRDVVLKTAVVVTDAVVNETFEAFIERSRLSKSDTIHKLKYFTLLKYLRDMYMVRYELRRTQSWGYLRNGSFDGMVGSLQRGEVDIGGSPIFYRIDRAKFIDVATETWNSKPVFIMRHPKHSGGYSTIFTRPFTPYVWCCVVLVFISSSIILAVLLKLGLLQWQGDDPDSSTSLAVLMMWSALCQQGFTVIRFSNSIKLVNFVTFLFAVTIYQYYNATVVSTLLQDPPKNIRTSKDLLKSNMKTGVHDVVYNKDFFKRTTDPVALQMYHKKIVTSAGANFFPLHEGMEMVKSGGFAFLVDSSIAYAVMRKTFSELELCEAHEVILYPPQITVAVMKKGSPYREHFAYGIRKMYESGLMKRIKSVWDEPRPACVKTPDSRLISVSIRECATPLVVLLGGMIIASLLLALEILYLPVSRFRSISAEKQRSRL